MGYLALWCQWCQGESRILYCQKYRSFSVQTNRCVKKHCASIAIYLSTIPHCKVLKVQFYELHNSDVIMRAMPFLIISLTIDYSTVYSGADQRKHQCSALQAFVRGIQRWPANSPHRGPVTQKLLPVDDVIMISKKTTPSRVRVYLWAVPLTPHLRISRSIMKRV